MMSKRNKLNRRPAMTVAVHEAGHAVAAVHYGIDFDHVTIIPNAEFHQGGRVKLNPVPEYASSSKTKNDPPAIRFWENYLVMTLAGPAAHKKRHPHAHWGGYAIGDIGQASRLIEDMHSDRDVRNAYYKYIEARAKAFVETYWYAIEAVATALVERGTLSDEEVRAIAGYVPKDKTSWAA
jgi:ATP-dependent Zn protease